MTYHHQTANVFPDGRHDPQALLTYVASLHLLQTLTLELVPGSSVSPTIETLGTAFSEWIALILAQLRGNTSLCSIDLNFCSVDGNKPAIPFVFLGSLINVSAQDSLLSLPSLQQLAVRLPVIYDAELRAVDSWTQELTRTLLSLKGCISVTIVRISR